LCCPASLEILLVKAAEVSVEQMLTLQVCPISTEKIEAIRVFPLLWAIRRQTNCIQKWIDKTKLIIYTDNQVN
jgi:hypothetical protein